MGGEAVEQDLPDSFEALFRQHYPAVVRKLRSILQDDAAAEDIAQEVFLRLYRSPPDQLGSVGAWLQRTLTRAAYDFLRQSARRRSLADKLEQTAAPDAAPDSETVVLRKFDEASLEEALARLSDRDRQVLLLRHSGYSYAEMARILKVNPDTVGTLLYRAGARLKKVYDEKGEWSDGAGRRREPGVGAL